MSASRVFLDACGRQVEVPDEPKRIVCLCPSLTETLVALGLQQRLLGRTRYCIHPAADLQAVAEVGGTKQIDIAALKGIQPDLIVAEKEENRREDVQAMSQHWPVYVCDIQNIEQALHSIECLGEITRTSLNAQSLVSDIRGAWSGLPTVQTPLRVLYLIWRKPWMAAGQNTYIDAVLRRMGLVNVAADLSGRYPQIASEQLADLKVDLCLLSSEPFPFVQKHREELADLMPGMSNRLVDGEMFSWYGARMLPAADYLARLIASLNNTFVS